MNFIKIVLFLASSYSLFSQSVTRIPDWNDRKMRFDYIHIPNYNDDGFWVENPSYYSWSNSFVYNSNDKHLHKKLTYRVNDLRFFKYSDASKYVSKIKRLAQKDGVEIRIAKFKDKRGRRSCAFTEFEDHVTCWHIDPAPKETISDYVGSFSIAHPSSKPRGSLSISELYILEKFHSKICHVYFTKKIFFDINEYVEKTIPYFPLKTLCNNFTPLLDVKNNNNKLNIKYEEDKDTYFYKATTQVFLKFLFLHKFSLNNDGFYAPKLITDHCNYCDKPHNRYETLDEYPRLVSSSPPSSFFEEFEELKNSFLTNSN
jgi:hypothetical protein